MNNENQHLELVKRIPIDQESPAHYPVKKFLLEKMRVIFTNRQMIRNAVIRKKKDRIMEAYKSNVHFGRKLKALKAAKEKLAMAEMNLILVGLDEEGRLLAHSYQTNPRTNQREDTVRWGGTYVVVDKEITREIERIERLIMAVEGETEPFSTFDQLETRMMMSSKVGELMAIMNAVAGEAVFEVKPSILQLTNGSEEE